MCKHKSNSTPHFRNVKLPPFFCICSIEKQENALISDRRLLLAVPVSNSVLMALERRAFYRVTCIILYNSNGYSSEKIHFWPHVGVFKAIKRLRGLISGGASFEILVRLRGVYFFGVDFYCIFGRFEEIIPNSKSQKVVRFEPHGPHSERRPCQMVIKSFNFSIHD